MKKTAPLVLALLVCAMPAHAAAPIVSYVLVNQSSAIERDVPVTFGAVFVPGDVPAGTSIAATDAEGKAIPLQVDAKAHNPDGSLRHAVLTLDLPRLAEGRDVTVAIMRGTPMTGAPVSRDALPAGFDAVVDLTLGDGHLTASAHDLLARSRSETWLSGPLVSEWWVAGPLRDASGKPDPHLTARFGIRSYGRDRPLRIEVDVESTTIWVPDPHTVSYDADIRIGGKSVFTAAGIVQQPHTRWRKVFWWSTPVDVFVKQDLAYLKKTRTIPNYNPAARDIDFAQLERTNAKNKHGPMDPGVIYPFMPVTGQRTDIGPLPGWTVAYLLTMDPRAAEMTMTAGDLSGGFQSHYRSEKTGRPATSEEFPKITTHYNYVGRPGNLPRPNLDGYFKGFSADASHQPSLAFVPYLVTGERYYLEELQFWSQWNAWDTAPEYHGFEKGLIGWDQVRGQGWSLRTLAQAAYITPDDDPMKATLLRESKANAAWYDKKFTNNPDANIFHADLKPSDGTGAIAPWMDDYVTWAAQYAVDLGFEEWRPFARWKAYFPVQRMINPDFCYVMATKYYMIIKDEQQRFLTNWKEAFVHNIPKVARANAASITCDSEAMVDAFRTLKPPLTRTGEMLGNAMALEGYPAQMQPALAAAVDAGEPGAREAWDKFRDRPVRPRKGVDPRWDIVPWDVK